jgi:hypothetical protein
VADQHWRRDILLLPIVESAVARCHLEKELLNYFGNVKAMKNYGSGILEIPCQDIWVRDGHKRILERGRV